MPPRIARAEEQALVIFVSPAGSDEGSGLYEDPMRTLEAALQKVVQNRTATSATIWMHGGEYRIERTITLSGELTIPLSIRAYTGETPVLTGSAPVTGFVETQRLGQTVWMASVHTLRLMSLYGGRGPLQPARWPKQGVLRVQKADMQDAFTGGSEKQKQFSAFYALPADVPMRMDGALVRMAHFWKDELSGVRSYDPATGRLAMNRPTAMTVEAGDAYWLENVLSAPMLPGEWAFDRNNQALYYAPREGERIDETVLYAPVTRRLITIDGVRDLTFDRITFAQTGWQIPFEDRFPDYPQAGFDADAAIGVRHASGVKFDHCVFRDIGEAAIRIENGVTDSVISRCTFENIGAQALYVLGVGSELNPAPIERLTVTNNLIRGYGRNLKNAAGILWIHARDSVISHNEIQDGYYTAISVGWVWGAGYNATYNMRIEDNLIYNIGQGLLSDLGGIYLLGNQPYTMVTGNVIHSVRGAEYGGWGIYLDEGASGIFVGNNLVYGCSSQGFFQHLGVRNTVVNNIFAYNEEGQVGTSDKEGKGTFALANNVLAGAGEMIRKITGKERVEKGENQLFASFSPFMDVEMGDFTLRGDLDLGGFVPWVYTAGNEPEIEITQVY